MMGVVVRPVVVVLYTGIRTLWGYVRLIPRGDDRVFEGETVFF